jgi:hypothetical protein
MLPDLHAQRREGVLFAFRLDHRRVAETYHGPGRKDIL